jgi:hypothetical protein
MQIPPSIRISWKIGESKQLTLKKKTPWSESTSELYRPSDRPLVDEMIANFFADRECHVVSVTDPYGRILGFIDRSH